MEAGHVQAPLRDREAALFRLVEGLLGKNRGGCRNVQSSHNGLVLMDGGSDEQEHRKQPAGDSTSNTK